jgi:hypothetical protein
MSGKQSPEKSYIFRSVMKLVMLLVVVQALFRCAPGDRKQK